MAEPTSTRRTRDDSDVREVMERSRTEEVLPSSQLRAMGMKVIAARDERDPLAAENARLRAALERIDAMTSTRPVASAEEIRLTVKAALTRRADGGA